MKIFIRIQVKYIFFFPLTFLLFSFSIFDWHMSWFSFLLKLWNCLNAVTEDVEVKEEAVNLLKTGLFSSTVGQILLDAWFPAWVAPWVSPLFVHIPAVDDCKFLFQVLFLYKRSKLFVFQAVAGVSLRRVEWNFR